MQCLEVVNRKCFQVPLRELISTAQSSQLLLFYLRYLIFRFKFEKCNVLIDLLLSHFRQHKDALFMHRVIQLKVELLLLRHREDRAREVIYHQMDRLGLKQFHRSKSQPFFSLHMLLGRVYLALHRPTQALKCYKFVLSCMSDQIDYIRQGEVYLGISKSFFGLNNPEKSLKYVLKAEQVLKRHLPFDSLHFLAASVHMEKLSKLSSCLSVQMKSREIIGSLSNFTRRSAANLFTCRIDLCRSRQSISPLENQMETACQLIRKNVVFIDSQPDLAHSELLVDFLFVMAQLCLRFKKRQLALEYLGKCEEILSEAEHPSESLRVLTLRCLHKMMIVCKILGKWKQIRVLEKKAREVSASMQWEEGNLEKIKLSRLKPRVKS